VVDGLPAQVLSFAPQKSGIITTPVKSRVNVGIVSQISEIMCNDLERRPLGDFRLDKKKTNSKNFLQFATRDRLARRNELMGAD
jgi:hypothetical protein